MNHSQAARLLSPGFILKWILLGLLIGGLVLFFIPGSHLPLNWQSLKQDWADFKQLQKQLHEPRSSVAMPSFADAVQLAGPAVVSINTFRPKAIRPLGEDKILDVSVGIGSGVIVSEEGFIVTNYHVIQGAEQISVSLKDGRKRYATLVGSDPATDLAVLKVELENLKAATLGESGKLRVGDLVAAIGNPLSLGQTVTLGIVSDIDHGPLMPQIKMDATINYGNSGGALINAKGEVVGINSRKLNSKLAGEVGINIAIPIDVVNRIVDEIIDHGRVIRNWFGISAAQLTLADYRTYFPNVEEGLGIGVSSTEPNSPADEAGIKPYDLITHVNGQPVHGIADFYQIYQKLPIGATIELTIVRKGEQLNLKVRLREKPADQ